MRGKQTLRDGQAIGVRIIPAHAGQTLAYYKPLQLPSDHPRACGANSALRPSNILQSGSSPRMRGKPRLCTAAISALRIIPAHAGQTSDYFSSEIISSDHPRACGANVEMHASLGSHVGSSPRMRGKLRQQLHVPELFRIIPAHAGQTVSIVPRSFASRFAGSSPRMRGKLRDVRKPCAFVRIIPAHAGQTIPTILHTYPHSDHPRACGANSPILCENS